jgi:dihydroorotate dehydrogenase
MSRALWKTIRAIAFRFDAEKVHHFFAGWMARLGAFAVGRALLRLVSGCRDLPVPTRVGVLVFRNPIGLAAGFDKTGELIRALPSLGFGSVEVGTVTPRPQPGNAKPRLFRDPERFTLFNRMGFNSPGAEVVARNIALARASGALPENFRIGVNLGKNKDTPAELAHEDYRAAVAPFAGLADYLVVNVSSPNTPGLRDLQAVPSLVRIFGAVREQIGGWDHRPPIFLKLAPEVSGDALEELLAEESRIGVEGWVLTNTLGGYWKGGRGGWSGGALGSLPLERLERVRSRSCLPIISVGGILQSGEAERRLRGGADLIQVYTGWVYFGPGWVPHLLSDLSTALASAPVDRSHRSQTV